MIEQYPKTDLIYGKNPASGVSEEIWKDVFTGAIVQIEIPHAAIHLGKYFVHTGVSTISNGASFDHLIIPPSAGGKFIHLRVFLFDTTSAPLVATLYEDTTVSANGTSHAGHNFNRNFDGATLALYHGPTITALGTEI